jgi:hypothetical protein
MYWCFHRYCRAAAVSFIFLSLFVIQSSRSVAAAGGRSLAIAMPPRPLDDVIFAGGA